MRLLRTIVHAITCWLIACGDKIMRRPAPPATAEEAAQCFETLLEQAAEHPGAPAARRFAGRHEMAVVVPDPKRIPHPPGKLA